MPDAPATAPPSSAAPAAPVTPAAAPGATTPAAAPAKPAAPKTPPINSLSAFDELDSLVSEGKKEKKSKPAEETEAEAEPVEETAEPEAEKSEPDKELAKIEPPVVRAKELRHAYEGVKKERDALKAEIESLKKNSKDDPERIAITDKLTKEEKRRAELEEEIKFLAYERSDDYKQKYQEPINKAYERACAEIKEYILTEENGNERMATVADFSAVMRLSPGEVVTATKAWFGDAAPEVRALRRNILELDRKSAEAVEDYRKKSKEIEETKIAEGVQQHEKAKQMWEKNNKEAVERYPQWFAPKTGDEEANKLLESGFALADLHFDPPKDLSLEKRVNLASHVRHRVAGFARVVLENKRLTAKLEAAEKMLSEYNLSTPDLGDGERKPKAGPRTWQQEIDDLAKSK